VDPVSHLIAEHVVDEPVLGDPSESRECRGLDDRIEVVAVAGDLRPGVRDAGFDPLPQLVRGHTHTRKRSDRAALYFVKQ